MIKINQRLKNNETASLLTQGPLKTNKHVKKGLFDQQVKNNYQSLLKNELTDLIKQIEQNGKQFSTKPNMANLLLYKKDIQLFLRVVTKNSYTIKEIYGRRLDYKILSTINQKLEDLTQQVMSREVHRLNLVAEIDEIKGLIVDLVF